MITAYIICIRQPRWWPKLKAPNGAKEKRMKFETNMTCEIFISDGNYTIGYVNEYPAQWIGNGQLTDGQEFDYVAEDGSFGVDYDDQYIVVSNEWRNRADY